MVYKSKEIRGAVFLLRRYLTMELSACVCVCVCVCVCCFVWLCMAVLGCPGKKTQRRTSRASTSGVWITTCTSSLQLPTLKRTVSEGRRVCVCKHVCLCVSLCLSVFARIVSIPFIILFAASDDSILVSKAVHIEINGITLKPAGKDTVTHSHTHTHTHTHRKGLVFTHLRLSFLRLSLSICHQHVNTYSYVSYLHTYICNPIALTLFMPL